MSNEAERQYFNHVPPTQSTVPGVGVTRIATSATAAVFDMSAYPHLFNKRLMLQNESVTAGDSIAINFSSDGVIPVDATAAGGSTLANSTAAANGFKLLPGASLIIRLDRLAQRYIHIDALANTPVLCVFPYSQGIISEQ